MHHVNEALIVTDHVEQARRSLTLVPRADSRGASVIYVEDPFRAPITNELRHRVLELLRRGGRTIVLDLSRVSRIDAAGIGQLVRTYNVTVAANGTLQLVHATAWVREILERVGLFDLLSAGRQRCDLQRHSRSPLSDREERGRA